MSFKAISWTVLAAIALATVLIFNYWASYQPLSTLAYAGIVLALAGLANLALPFRFLGIRKRYVGALVLVGGIGLAGAALLWPAPTIHVAQRQKLLDDILPEYQFHERHAQRIHASPAKVMQAVRESRFRDLRSIGTLMKIRAAALRTRDDGSSLQNRQVLEAFSASGYASGGTEHEVVMCGGADARAKRPLQFRTLAECADYREPGALKVAFDFKAEDSGDGWCTVTTETRVVALDDATRRGMGRYWRLIVPGSGLLRLQWLDSIRKRAES